MKRYAVALLALAVASPGLAQEGGQQGSQQAAQGGDPRFCPTRPSLGASACTTEPGKVQLEVSALDWQRDDTGDSREDRILAGDLLARFGVGATTEVQVGWTAFGHVRTRDKATGAVDAADGVGDVTLAVRQNLRHPDGKGLSFGIEPQVTLPVGHSQVGAGDWGAGVVLPVSYDLGDKINLQFTGEGDAAVDEDGDGRHLAYSGIWGLAYAVSDKVTATAELSVQRDDDPAGHETHSLAALSFAFQPRKTLQFDMLAVAGLNHTSPDVRLVTGGAILF
jgi:hypothetical protein